MTPQDVREAFYTALNGDRTKWENVLNAVRRGDLVVVVNQAGVLIRSAR